jgi:CRISPR-associated protein Csd1
VTILQSLDGYYGRMAARGEAEPTGFSAVPLFETVGKKRVPQMLNVPAAVKRTAGIASNLLWDKTAYVLGRTAGEGRRTADEHAAFKRANLAFIGVSDDTGLTALRRFLETWTPDRFDAVPFGPAMLDTNIVFALDDDRKDLHDRPAVQALLAGQAGRGTAQQTCLVTGQLAAPVRLHPVIKGVWDSQTGGASLVSFNLDAFTSYGKEQGDNAPTSEMAAFRYGAALNRMLDKGSRNRLPRPVGDASVVFWADTSEAVQEFEARAAEDAMAGMMDPPDDAGEAAKLRDKLELLQQGRPVADAMPEIVAGTRFHVLGLAPNAARLSVRYWLDGTFAEFAKRLAGHYEATHIEPRPWGDKPPSVNRLLVRTVALQEKFENIPKQLAGEVMRAVLSGVPYPRSWLASTVVRLRAGDNPGTGWHAAGAAVVPVCDARP